MSGSVYYIVGPIVIVVVILKVCLIGWRIWVYQKRKEEQRLWLQQQRIAAAPATARVVSVRRVTAPDGIAQQTSYAIERPGCPTRHLTRTVVVRPVSGRPLDPNLPPTYNQAISGSDRSVKVEEGTNQGATFPPQSGDPSAPPPVGPPPGFTDVNVGPAAPPPPAYSNAPTAVSFPPPAAVIHGRNDSEEEDGIDDDDRRLLLS